MKCSLIGTCFLFSTVAFAEHMPVKMAFCSLCIEVAPLKGYPIEEVKKEIKSTDHIFNCGKDLKYTALNHSIKAVTLKSIEKDHQKILVIEVDYSPLKKNGKRRNMKLQYCLSCI